MVWYLSDKERERWCLCNLLFLRYIYDLCVATRLIFCLYDYGCFLYGVPTSWFLNKEAATRGYPHACIRKHIFLMSSFE